MLRYVAHIFTDDTITSLFNMLGLLEGTPITIRHVAVRRGKPGSVRVHISSHPRNKYLISGSSFALTHPHVQFVLRWCSSGLPPGREEQCNQECSNHETHCEVHVLLWDYHRPNSHSEISGHCNNSKPMYGRMLVFVFVESDSTHCDTPSEF